MGTAISFEAVRELSDIRRGVAAGTDLLNSRDALYCHGAITLAQAIGVAEGVLADQVRAFVKAGRIDGAGEAGAAIVFSLHLAMTNTARYLAGLVIIREAEHG